MPNNDLSIIIDPGGVIGVRDGINIQAFITAPITLRPDPLSIRRTSNGNLLAKTSTRKYNFTTEFYLDQPEYLALRALYEYSLIQSSNAQPFEIVVYMLAEPFSEIVPERTRYMVPGTSVVNTTDMTNGLFEITYYIAVQGAFNMASEREGTKYKINFTFDEGFKLTSDLEP